MLYRSPCVATSTTCKRMLILSDQCARAFGSGKKLQRSGSNWLENSTKEDHSSPTTFFGPEVDG